MVVAVMATSTGAPLIKATAAPALAIGFWRMAIAGGLLLVFAVPRRAELRLRRRQLALTVLAGGLLATHLAAFVVSISMTQVASAVALAAMQPAWAALVSRWRGEDILATGWMGVSSAVVGALLLTGVDLTLSRQAVLGDVIALFAGVAGACSRSIGAEVRRDVATLPYTTVCYSTAAVVLLVACVISGQDLAGYDPRSWLRLAALAVAAQLVGHSIFNFLLKTISPTVLSVALLFEIVGATLIAAVFLQQRPSLLVLPAAGLIAGGTVAVIRATHRVGSELPPVEIG